MAHRLEPRNEPMHRCAKVLYSGSMVYGSPQDAAYATAAEVQHAAHSLTGLGQVGCCHQPARKMSLQLNFSKSDSNSNCKRPASSLYAQSLIRCSILICGRHTDSTCKPAAILCSVQQALTRQLRG